MKVLINNLLVGVNWFQLNTCNNNFKFHPKFPLVIPILQTGGFKLEKSMHLQHLQGNCYPHLQGLPFLNGLPTLLAPWGRGAGFRVFSSIARAVICHFLRVCVQDCSVESSFHSLKFGQC